MIGQQAPTFDLLDQDSARHSLDDYRGRWVVLFFYTHDDAIGCTKQACSFRDEYRIIKQFGDAEILGINHGSVERHKQYTKDHRLNFPILSDPDCTVTKSYNSWKRARAVLFGKNYGTQRNTFLVSPDGHIAKEYIGVKRSGQHTEQVIADLQSLQKQSVASS